MRSKVIFDHPNWVPAAILCKFCIPKLKLRIDMKWREMRLKVTFGHPNLLSSKYTNSSYLLF